jgi:hypothetical protein
MKAKIFYSSLACVIILVVLLALCSPETYMSRWMKWRASDIMDYEKFPASALELQ